MAKTTFLRKGACVIASAALAAAMVPAAALADDQTSTGTGTTEVETSSVEVTYDKDCSWTATYPTSVTMGTNADGTASADIEFNVKGLIDVDHQVTITPTSTSIELTGARHEGTLAATIAGPSSGAAATDVNSDDGATVKGSASATADDVSAAAVDTYKGTTTFKIKCGVAAKKVATFTDGVSLTWDELKLESNGEKYGYNADSITDEALLYTYDSSTGSKKSAFYSYDASASKITYCTSLVSIDIPDSVTSIGSNAFHSCSKLTNVTLGSGVTSIGHDAFHYCSSLTSIVIPDSVTSISNSMFMLCSSLTTVTLGSGVTSIGYYPFDNTQVTSLTYNGTMAAWGSITKDSMWNYYGKITTIHCTDGDVTL